MYHIIDDRASGKTSRLMLIAKENNAINKIPWRVLALFPFLNISVCF